VTLRGGDISQSDRRFVEGADGEDVEVVVELLAVIVQRVRVGEELVTAVEAEVAIVKVEIRLGEELHFPGIRTLGRQILARVLGNFSFRLTRFRDLGGSAGAGLIVVVCDHNLHLDDQVSFVLVFWN